MADAQPTPARTHSRSTASRAACHRSPSPTAARPTAHTLSLCTLTHHSSLTGVQPSAISRQPSAISRSLTSVAASPGRSFLSSRRSSKPTDTEREQRHHATRHDGVLRQMMLAGTTTGGCSLTQCAALPQHMQGGCVRQPSVAVVVDLLRLGHQIV